MDEPTRQRLHQRLDDILNLRSQIEHLPTETGLAALLGVPPALPDVDEEKARTLFHAMMSVAIDALGEGVRRAAFRRLYRHESDQRSLLKGWLLELWPLLNTTPQTVLAIAPNQELTIFDAIDALSALDAGEIKPLFRANTGKNRRANRWSLARTKLEALAWKKRLLALGYGEKAANYEVTKAFREQWDTIRKWKGQCEQILGLAYVRAVLDFAGSAGDTCLRQTRVGLFPTKPDPIKILQIAGDTYGAELRRSAQLSRRKSGTLEQ